VTGLANVRHISRIRFLKHFRALAIRAVTPCWSLGYRGRGLPWRDVGGGPHARTGPLRVWRVPPSVPPTRSAWGSIVPTSRLRDQETCVRYSLTRPSCGRIIRAVRRGEWGRGAASVRRRLFRRTWRVGSD